MGHITNNICNAKQLLDSNKSILLIQACAQMLKDGVKHGVEAVKSILGRWGTDLRWLAVLELEEVAVHELRQLEELVPQFYNLLSEEVLPMQGIG